MLAPSKLLLAPFLLSGFTATLIGMASSALATVPSARSTQASSTESMPATLQGSGNDYGQIPLHFERNQGQAPTAVQYLARGQGYGLFLESSAVVLGLNQPGSTTAGFIQPSRLTPAATRFVRADLVAANGHAAAEAEGPLAGYSNYLIGADPKRWRTQVPQFERVRYRDVYPHIDLVYYGDQQQLEYDFVVAPAGNPQSIHLHFSGIDAARVDDIGALHLQIAGADLVEHKPAIYQTRDGTRVPVEGHFNIVNSSNSGVEVAFAVGDYDRARPLIIDPILSYSTLLSGSLADAPGGIAVDKNGNAYLAGSTISVDFPTTAGTVQTANAGLSDAFIAKLSTDGKSLSYATYLGGSQDDFGSAIAVDSTGEVYVGGSTSSPDFPVSSTALQQTLMGSGTSDAFVAKLSADGSTLLYSTYLGGSNNDGVSGIAIDSHGSAYVTGQTYSTDFPTVASSISRTMPGSWDTFVAKLNASGSTLLHSTYLGGVNDTPGGIAVDSSGATYVTGSATTSFPVTTGAFQTVNAGSRDGYVSKISADGKSFVYSTFLGGSANDAGQAIAIDSSGSAYIAGATASTDFPVTKGAYQTKYKPKVSGAFVTKLSADGSSQVYSSYLDGTQEESANAIAVDALGRAYVTGSTQSTDFPTTAGAPQSQNAGSDDAFVSLLNAAGNALIYSTYQGGTGSDLGTAIAVDTFGNAYVAGQTSSTNFPTTDGALQTGFNGSAQEAFALRIAPFTANPSSLDFGDVNAGTVSSTQTLTFTNAGPSTLTITSLTTATQQFKQTNTCAGSVAAGANCSITVKFVPTSIGAAEDTLTIATSDGPALVRLTGFGAGRGAVLSPVALIFADQLVGTVSSGKFINVTNNGTDTLTVNSVTTSAGFIQSNACINVSPGTHCPIQVSFAPTATGPAAGTLTIQTNAYQNPAPASLSGNGVISIATLSPGSLAFGNHQLGTTSGIKTINLSNAGTAPLAIVSITATAPFAQTNTCDHSVAVGAQCSISVTFSPTALGSASGTITIVSDAVGSPTIASLSGAGIGPQASLSASSLSFGNQAVKTTGAAKTVTLTNSGTTNLTVSSITADAGFVETNSCGTLAAGSSCPISVSFAPTTSGSLKGTLTINSNAYGSPATVKLSGTGIDLPAVSLSPTSLDFGNHTAGTTSGNKAIKLTNTGTAVLSIIGIVTNGQFTQTNTCGSGLAAGANCTINVAYVPVSIGTTNGAVTLNSNAVTSPDTVSLSGKGTGPQASLSPGALSFGSLPITTTSPSQTVTLTNTGTASLTVSSIAVTSGFIQTNSCGTLAAGSNCPIKVSFAPTTVGAANGTLTVNTNAYGSPTTISLSGSGTAVAKISLSPTSLDFGNHKVGTTSGVKAIHLTNSGTVTLTINSIIAYGPFARTTTCGSSLAAGANCVINVTFTPTATGAATGNVTINSNGVGGQNTAALSGDGT